MISQPARLWDRAPHLTAAAIAMVSTAALFSVLFGALHIEKRLARLTAPEILEVKDQGISLQEEAFSDKRLLPVYGSSEFMNDTPYAGRIFFKDFPTGFEIFVVGKAGAKTLIIAQRIAALGHKVRGQKVVIILSPTWFMTKREPPKAYDANFSALQASELAFNSPLSRALKRDFATEMLKYPETLEGHGLLRMELERLAAKSHTVEDRLLGEIGRSENDFLQLLDSCQTVFALSGEMLEHPSELAAHRTHGAQKQDWDGLFAEAAKFSHVNSYENSMDDALASPDDMVNQKLDWKFSGEKVMPFGSMLTRSDEWSHLDILLRTLKELGAKPLILSIPINATAFKTEGVTPTQRELYYTHLRKEVGAYNFPVATFEENDGDPNFFGDAVGHPSAKGWMTFNKTISQFYHGKLPSHLD